MTGAKPEFPRCLSTLPSADPNDNKHSRRSILPYIVGLLPCDRRSGVTALPPSFSGHSEPIQITAPSLFVPQSNLMIAEEKLWWENAEKTH